MTRVLILSCDDWEGIYIDGDVVGAVGDLAGDERD